MFLVDKNLNPPPAKVFTPDLKGLIAWLETKDQSEKYDWCGVCLFQQFGMALGFGTGNGAYVAAVKAIRDANPSLKQTGEPWNFAMGSSTFGEALDGARAELARQ